MDNKNYRNGFSLLELMVVIALGMILLSLTAINARFFKKAAIVSELNVLHATCNYLQQTAMARNQQQELRFDIAKNCYRFHDQCHQLSPGLYFDIMPSVKGPPSSPQHTLNKATTFAHDIMIFGPDGIISSGTVYITNTQQLYALSSAVAHVSCLRKYRYDGTWHNM